MKNLFKVLFLSVLLLSVKGAFASEHEAASHDTEELDAVHHVMDAHDIHLWGSGHEAVSVPLPIILWTENGLVTFMSSEFHHDDAGQTVVEKNDLSFVKHHEKIYQLDAENELLYQLGLNDSVFVDFYKSEFSKNTHGDLYLLKDGTEIIEKDHKFICTNSELNIFAKELDAYPISTKALDFSITKVVVAVFLVAFIMFFVFKAVAKKYKLGAPAAPKGIASWMEPLVLFVRDFAKENIGDKKYMKFMPYLLTVFFFIWFGNLLGLIPFIGGINMTGNISITLTLALITLVIQMVNSKWAFWSHMLMPPGVPVLLYPILVPIELLGLIIKPAALMIRLFANITAGHVIVLSIIGIIFMNHSFAWAGLSVPLALFISVLEVTLVAFLQAYIFTMLSSMFIGSAVEEAHH